MKLALLSSLRESLVEKMMLMLKPKFSDKNFFLMKDIKKTKYIVDGQSLKIPYLVEDTKVNLSLEEHDIISKLLSA